MTPPVTIPAMPGRVREIMEQVCARNGMRLPDLLGQSRMKTFAHARFEAAAQIHAQIKIGCAPPSLPQIGRWMNRDHTSILNALRRHKELFGESWMPVSSTAAPRALCVRQTPPAKHRLQMLSDLAEAIA